MAPRKPTRVLRDDLDWLLRTTNDMLRCRSVASLLDLVYTAIREGLGYERVSLLLVDGERRGLVTHLATDEHGEKLYPRDWLSSLQSDTPHALLLADPRLHIGGPGFIYATGAAGALPAELHPQRAGRLAETMLVSLRTATQVIGLIGIDNLISGRPLVASDAPPLVACANALAAAIENVTLLGERDRRIDDLDSDLRRRVAELEWLRDVSRRVTAAATLDEMLDIVYDGIRDGLGYDRVGINLFDRETGIFEDLRGTDEYGHKTCPTDRVVTLDQDSPIWRFPGFAAALRDEEFYYTADAAAECPPELLYLFDSAPKHNLMVPLRSGDKATGVISVDNLLSKRPISPQDAGPLVALGNQLGTAVENARLRERERAEHARLELLLESARALNSTLDRDQILHTLAVRLVQALDAASAAFTEVDLAERRCRVLTDYVAPGRAPISNPSSWGSLDLYPVLEEVLRTRAPFHGHVDDPDFPASERTYLRERQLEAELIVPVVVQGLAAQALEVHWQRWISIGPDTIALCTAIAEQAAVALENARLYADAAERAERDALTGLLNHRALLDQLDSALQGSNSVPCALLLIDVDNFKLFNDTYGHPVGDAVLNRVATTLRDACRDGDVAGRYGGDEFALLLRGASAAEAAAATRRLHTQVRTRPYVTPDGTIIPLSISIGLACAPRDAQTRQEMIAMADQAMYEAKRGSSATWQRQAADLLGDTPFGVLEGLVNAVDGKDRYTREHSEDVTQLALLLAVALGLDEEQQRVLAVAGPLHDVGKIAVPDRILRKPGRLTAEEYAVIKRHVAYGVAIIRGVLDDAAVVDAVAYHHERWDGRGYPNGVTGPETPLSGRIMQIADAVSAMMMDRPYRQGMAWAQVVTELRAGAGGQFDRELVEVFIAATSRRYAATAS